MSLQLLFIDKCPTNGGKRLRIEPKALKLLRDQKSPCFIISVCGEQKAGKSFLLNKLVKGFSTLVKDPEGDFMGWDDTSIPLEQVFPFGHEQSHRTQGVWITADPIQMVSREGENICVFFLDCEGIGSESSCPEQDAAVLSLCLALSSLTIVNVKGQIDGNMLVKLSEALKNSGKWAEPRAIGDVLFLVRDWVHTEEFKGGKKDGKQYLEKRLKKERGQSREEKSAREVLNHWKENLSCILMPHPGEEALTANFVGTMESIDAQFSCQLETLIAETFHDVKPMANKQLRITLLKLIETYAVQDFAFQLTSLIESYPMYVLPLNQWDQTVKKLQTDCRQDFENIAEGNYTQMKKMLDDFDSECQAISKEKKIVNATRAEEFEKILKLKEETILDDFEDELKSHKKKSIRRFREEANEAIHNAEKDYKTKIDSNLRNLFPQHEVDFRENLKTAVKKGEKDIQNRLEEERKLSVIQAKNEYDEKMGSTNFTSRQKLQEFHQTWKELVANKYDLDENGRNELEIHYEEEYNSERSPQKSSPATQQIDRSRFQEKGNSRSNKKGNNNPDSSSGKTTDSGCVKNKPAEITCDEDDQNTLKKYQLTLEKVRKDYSDGMTRVLDGFSHFSNEEFNKQSEKLLKKVIGNHSRELGVESAEKIQINVDDIVNKFRKLNIMKATTSETAIGIDLGTTYTCVAVYENGKVRCIEAENGMSTFPSYVDINLSGKGAIVGQQAKDEAHENPKTTIFDAKRLIGRRFRDKHVQENIKTWPFEVINSNGNPNIKIEDKLYEPEKISSKILRHAKNLAENNLGASIRKAVITVPAYFNDGQRQATRDAGEIAGLEVLQVLVEPTAAAMAYYIDHFDVQKKSKTILVFDLGGGTFDVSILTLEKGEITVKSVDGDAFLGGVDFDTTLMNYCIQKFCEKHSIPNDSIRNPRQLRRLRNECEKVKKILSEAGATELIVDAFHDGKNLEMTITRESFEKMNYNLFQKSIEITRSALKTAKLTGQDIDEVVLVGGSAKIPIIQNMLAEELSKQKLNKTVNPDEAVAIGAAIQAAILNNHGPEIKFTDVTPFSLGIETVENKFSVIIPKNTAIPCKEVKEYVTSSDNQTEVEFTIYQGEDPTADKNERLGEFCIRNIPKNTKGKEKVQTTMSVDKNGILNVTAMCESTESKNVHQIKLEATTGRLTEEQKENLRR